MAEAPVLFDLLPAKGKHIGVATLNSEKTLNSLSLPMIDLLTAKLNEWCSDNNIAMVMLQGKGDRAFSAGGDIQDLYRSMCGSLIFCFYNFYHNKLFLFHRALLLPHKFFEEINRGIQYMLWVVQKFLL